MQIDTTKTTPVPPARASWPFAEMEVGDLTFVPQILAQSARTCAIAYRKRNPGWDYRTKRTEKDGVVGINLFRTS